MDRSSSKPSLPPSHNRANGHPPSIDVLARSLSAFGLPHPLNVQLARHAIASGQIDFIEQLARSRKREFLTPVVNATGVLLHTNLGRSPIDFSPPAGASNLELSLASGKRGSRQTAVGDLLAAATGAESAMIVNNCAGAVLLVLAALANGRGAVVSRGELVEIGGGFRIPDVMEQSNANLIEVGTTNRTRLSDFEAAVANNDVALVMQIHQSNYEIVGFTESVPLADLCKLDVPVIADIGSGLIDAACPWLSGPPPAWLSKEPAAKQSLEAGADLVLFSGDKLFGGPQAGIIAGNAELVNACAKHPLARALRPGGLVLSSLQETTLAYLDRDGSRIPFWNMATIPVTELQTRAQAIIKDVGSPTVVGVETSSVPGGGTLPGIDFPSFGVEIKGNQVDSLRDQERPIIGRITNSGTTILDLRTVDASDDSLIAAAITAVIATGPTETSRKTAP